MPRAAFPKELATWLHSSKFRGARTSRPVGEIWILEWLGSARLMQELDHETMTVTAGQVLGVK